MDELLGTLRVPEDVAEAVWSACRGGGPSIANVVATAGLGPAEAVRAAVLRLLWQQRLSADLHRYLDAGTLVTAAL